MTATPPRPELLAADRPEADWNDPRRAITHALGCGPRLGWAAVEGTDGELATVTYTRGNGSARQTVTARFRVVVTTPRTPVDFYRFTGGQVALDAAAEGEAVRTWGAIMAALYREPTKARRAPKGSKAGAARRPRRTARA